MGKPHGLEGAFVVEDASEDPARFGVGAELIVPGGLAHVVESKHAGGRPVIRLDTRVERGAPLEVTRESLGSAGADEYYVFQLVGLDVVEDGGRGLGKVADIAPGVANDVLELDTGLSLPMVEDCVKEVDLNARRIVVAQGFADAD